MNARRKQAVAFFIQQGWTAQQSAGIVANLEAESGLRPDAVGDGGQAYGIAQWHPPRQANFAALLGKDIRGSTLEEQLYFVHAELRGTEQQAGAALAACTTAADAGSCVSRLYERPADSDGEAAKRERLAASIFEEFGSAATPGAAPAPSQGTPMPALVALQLFGPLLANLIPQIASLFKPGSEVAQRNVGLAEVVVDTITKAASAPNLQAAVEKMQADPDVVKTVQKAVVTQPEIMATLQVTEIGGGIGAARTAAATAQVADKPFWFNPLTWVTLAFFPMMYMITYQVLFTLAGPYLVSNGVPNIPLQPNPWYAVVGFDPNTRTGLINLIVGFVFGGVCGIWFGTTVAKQRSDAATQTTTSDGATVTTTR